MTNWGIPSVGYVTGTLMAVLWRFWMWLAQWRVWKWLAQWRVWKWLVHLLTGKCELHRICLSKVPLEERAWRLEQSLKNSKSPVLCQVAEGGGEGVEEAVSAIAQEKKLDLAANVELAQRLRAGLVRVLSVRVLYNEVEGLRAHPYSQENEEHEKMLMELWSQLMPGEPLKARLSKQWQEIGFQGNNPATDFRSMGVLTVHCLLFFATRHRDRARSVLSHSHHPQHDYPFALVGIHLAGLLHSWLQRGVLSRYLYTTTSQWPPTIEEFHEIFCYLFNRFDQFWLEKKPENVMVFPQLKKEFAEQVQELLSAKNITVLMRLQYTQ